MFMHDFLLKSLSNTNIEKELKNIGFDSSYTNHAKNKFCYKNFKIYNLTCAQANIIKQLALSVGADCGTNKDVITGNAEFSHCILGGSNSQLYKISEKLEKQPFGLKNLGQLLKNELKIEATQKTKIIGILNITPNSFSDGGEFYQSEDAIKQLNKLINDGADIIDIGAESTRPGAEDVCAKTQLERLIPVIKYIKENNITIPVSVDTRNAEVAKKCIDLGVNIINDVSGLDFDENMANIIAQNSHIKVIIQHYFKEAYTGKNLMDDIYIELYNKVENAIKKGIKKENIIIDPGIGFGKTKEQNFEIIKRWKELKTIGCPILIGLSRKSLLNMQDSSNIEKDIYTLALNTLLINENIDYIRVHNVELHKNIIEIL